MNINNRLKPNTEFIIYRPMHAGADYMTSLNELYLPLIGPKASMVYIYMFESTEHHEPLAIRFHKEFMDALSISLSDLMEMIRKLEGIGLLKSHVSNNAHEDLFVYELLLPLSPAVFFKDPMLSMYLYGKVGNAQYKIRKERLVYPALPENITEVTAKFTEVFNPNNDPAFTLPKENFKQEAVSAGVNVDLDDFDFEVLFTHLKGTIIDRKYFTKEVRMLIVKLSVLFNLNAYDMKNILLKVTSNYHGIDTAKLKYEARKYFQMESKQVSPVLEAPGGENTGEGRSDSDAGYIRMLNETNPIDRLRDLRHGMPTDIDLKLVTDIIVNTTLSHGVVNILLEYVYLKMEGELPYNYTMTIAKDWMEKGYQHPDEAIAAIKERDAQQEKRKRRFIPSERQGEKAPKWMSKKQDAPAVQKQTKKEKPDKTSGTVKKTAKDDPELQKMIEEFRKNR
ncbi:replication initiation and membrane attachment family protein [Lacicoccus alkaliphilus]|uniref:Replicative DNA helicase loader DnaB n=1 Tax=Lacicoccus alkaliphilus DSM 16010 TaxID=1123231 RepID=A0A1M7APX2_9BACL|nr:DnaD domain protein [Salinicoccus alkaliphilus]SHL44794.1 replicative DNA helicase loader DnaB [Salinicoccus alkaliphilus DSM 16010]